MTQDELAVLDKSKCVLPLRGERPFLSERYDITKHSNYRFISDQDSLIAFGKKEAMRKNLYHIGNQVSEVYGFIDI